MAGHEVSAQRDIVAEPSQVWAFFQDLERLGRLLSSVVTLQRVEGVGVAPGVRWRETRSVDGRTQEIDMVVEEATEPSRLVFMAEVNGTTVRTTYDIKPSSLGTRLVVTRSEDAARASASQRLSWAMRGSAGDKGTKSALERDLEDIGAAVEQLLGR